MIMINIYLEMSCIFSSGETSIYVLQLSVNRDLDP